MGVMVVKTENDFKTPDKLKPLIAATPVGQHLNHKEEPVVARITESTSSGQFSGRSLNFDFFHNHFKKLKCKKGRMAKSPWLYEVEHTTSPAASVRNFYDWLKENSSSTLIRYAQETELLEIFIYNCLTDFILHFRNWVVHSLPRYIELSGYDFKDILVKGAILSPEAFDAAVRRLGQLDRSMFMKIGKKLWRHVFESDFSVSKTAIYHKNNSSQRHTIS